MEIVWHIAQGHVLDVLVSSQEQYRHQRQLVVAVRGYAYLVPVVEERDGFFFKTIIPSRKLPQSYLRAGDRSDAAVGERRARAAGFR